MLQEIFNMVWKLAAQGTLMMLCILLARPLLKKMPRNLTCLLWAVLAFRLILPWSIPVTLPEGQVAGFSLLQGWNGIFIPDEADVSLENEALSGGGLTGGDAGMEMGMQPKESFAPDGAASGSALQLHDSNTDTAAGAVGARILEKRSRREIFWRICPFLWAVGAATVCVYWIAMDLRLRRRVREAVLVKKIRQKIRVMECGQIETAFVLGIFRPVIYLPDMLENPDRRYVLLHEKMHLCRKDHIWKWVACLLLCIYWFHPLLWICASAFSRDVEEACDEAVLRKLGAGGKLPYARAIFHEADAGKAHWASAPGFGEGNMKKRVKHVLDYKKKTAAGVILTTVLILGACGPFFVEKRTTENETTSAAAAEPSAEAEERLTENEEQAAENGEQIAENVSAGPSGEAWTVQPVTEEELTDPMMAADNYRVMLRRSEGGAEDVSVSYENPVEGARISDTYCVRQHPATQEKRLHSGVDFAIEEGTPVLAAASGSVVETGFEVNCGNYVILRHENGDLTYYAHCAEILAAQGDVAEAGEQIATVGSTGISTGSHLHFALSRDGVFIDPMAEPAVSEETLSYRESLTADELVETEKIALEYCNQMGWGNVISIEAVIDDCVLYENEGIESEYAVGNIIIYEVSTKEDEAAGNPKRTVSVARADAKRSWSVINGGFSGYQEEPVITLSKSEKFDEEEILAAMEAAETKLEEFAGCTLTKLWYDEEYSDRMIESYLISGKGSKNGANAKNTIVLLSDFTVDESGGDGSLNPNSTYTDWNWILIRDDGKAQWTVDDWGY